MHAAQATKTPNTGRSANSKAFAVSSGAKMRQPVLAGKAADSGTEYDTKRTFAEEQARRKALALAEGLARLEAGLASFELLVPAKRLARL